MDMSNLQVRLSSMRIRKLFMIEWRKISWRLRKFIKKSLASERVNWEWLRSGRVSIEFEFAQFRGDREATIIIIGELLWSRSNKVDPTSCDGRRYVTNEICNLSTLRKWKLLGESSTNAVACAWWHFSTSPVRLSTETMSTILRLDNC